jgi:N-acetylmuramoyl-L-alanine amidase
MKFVLLFLLSFASVFASVSCNEVVAAVIIHEAGGEGERGMQAVAGVISNRTRANRDAFAVVTRPNQFECITGKSYDAFVAKAKRHARWAYALKLAEEIDNKTVVDITGGATHFHNPSKTPWWAKKMAFTKKIGNHLFYREG